MTKRRQKTHSAIIHATSAVSTAAVYMAQLEQLFEMVGPTAIASHLSERLRDPKPPLEVIAAVACLLDPQNNYSFKLEVVRRRRGKSWTKEVNDVAIAKAVLVHRQWLIAAGRPKHGSTSMAIRKVAKQYEVSQAKVRQVWRRNLVPK
jgi:hypothetical protein